MDSQLIRPRILASIFYLAYYASVGAIMPYLNLYYQNLGMNRDAIGILAALPTIMVIFAGPLWGGIADAFNLHKHILPLAIVGSIIPALLLMQATQFWALAILVLSFWFFTSPIIPLADSAVLEFLGDDRNAYGHLRIWGAVGFGLSAWGSGELIERNGMWIAFTIYICVMLMGLYVGRQLPVTRIPSSESYWDNLGRLIRNASWIHFLIALFLLGIGFSILNNYFVLYLTELGASEGLYGLSIASAGISELPVFLFSAVLLRWLQPRGLIIIAFIALITRGLVYSVIIDPHWAIAAQLLHGPSFSMLWVAAVIYVRNLAPSGLEATAQAALGAVLFGLSNAAGALIGARLYNELGPVSMFRIASLIAFCGLVFFALMQLQSLWSKRLGASYSQH